MNNEIKEILNRLERIDHKEYSGGFEFADTSCFDEVARCFEERKKMANYITNLQQEFKEANESTEWWTNRFKAVEKENEHLRTELNAYENPDDLTLFYMWIDEKAKDKMKKLQQENERLKDELETMTFTAKVKQEAIDALIKRIDKVAELIEPFIDWGECTINGKILKQIADILKGDNNE